VKTEIETNVIACRKACKDSKVGDVMQHIHHGQWLERLTEPIENRIAFILSNKEVSEQAKRLCRLRPFDRDKADADRDKAYADWNKADADWNKAYADWKKAYADWKKADADWKKADASPVMVAVHAEVCGCPWDATHDIFGKRR
jgi:hypothetical protein